MPIAQHEYPVWGFTTVGKSKGMLVKRGMSEESVFFLVLPVLWLCDETI